MTVNPNPVRNSLTAAVVATFEPSEQVLQLVGNLLREGVRVLVADDASASDDSDRILTECEVLGATVLRHESNQGIGRSLNDGVGWAQNLGAHFLLTMDQDTELPAGYVDSAVALTQHLHSQGVSIGLVTAATINGRPPRRHKRRVALEALDVIQSGCLYPLDVFEAYGLFREDFVIDSIDTEFCLRLRKYGRVIALHPDLAITHALGQSRPATLFGIPIRIGGRVISATGHSDWRRYFITRNRILVWSEYARHDDAWRRESGRSQRRETLIALVGERGRLSRLRSVFWGTVDGLRGRTGMPHHRGIRR